jgi:hypothetical protein
MGRLTKSYPRVRWQVVVKLGFVKGETWGQTYRLPLLASHCNNTYRVEWLIITITYIEIYMFQYIFEPLQSLVFGAQSSHKCRHFLNSRHTFDMKSARNTKGVGRQPVRWSVFIFFFESFFFSIGHPRGATWCPVIRPRGVLSFVIFSQSL